MSNAVGSFLVQILMLAPHLPTTTTTMNESRTTTTMNESRTTLNMSESAWLDWGRGERRAWSLTSWWCYWVILLLAQPR